MHFIEKKAETKERWAIEIEKKNVHHQDKCAAHMFKKSSLCRIYATAVVIAVEWESEWKI